MLLCRRRVVCMLNFLRLNLSFEFELSKPIDGLHVKSCSRKKSQLMENIAFFMCGRPGSVTAVVGLIEC